MSSVVTTSGNGLKMKIQRKSQRQVADLESNNNNNNSALVTPLATAKTKGGAELPSQEDNKIKKMVDECGKSGANKMPHGAKSKCKGMKQAKYGKEKKIKKKFEKVLKNFQENDSVPEDDTIPFSSSSSTAPSFSPSLAPSAPPSAPLSAPPSTTSSNYFQSINKDNILPSQSAPTTLPQIPPSTSPQTSLQTPSQTPSQTFSQIFSQTSSASSHAMNSAFSTASKAVGNSVKHSTNKTDKKSDNSNAHFTNEQTRHNHLNNIYNNNNSLVSNYKNSTNKHRCVVSNNNNNSNINMNHSDRRKNSGADKHTHNKTDNHTSKNTSAQLSPEKVVCTKTAKSSKLLVDGSVSRLESSLHQGLSRPSALSSPMPSSSPSSNLSTPPAIHTSSVLSTYTSLHTFSHLSTRFVKNHTASENNHASHPASNQPSIHPNLATPPSTPPCTTSCSPLSHYSRQDMQTDTHDMATGTEPDCLGPCEPGTSVVLEGIVWNESDNGILVVNVTWRGKTYVGTLMDSTRHDWAPPRFIEDDLAPTGIHNYHHYYSWTSCSSSSSSSSGSYTQKSKGEESSTAISSEVRKFRKCRKDAAAVLSQQQHATNSSGRHSLTSHKALKSYSFEKEPVQNKTGFFDCPSSHCLKKFRHLAGLRYHQSHAHSKHRRGRPESSLCFAEHHKTSCKSPEDRGNKARNSKEHLTQHFQTPLLNVESCDLNINIDKRFSNSPRKLQNKQKVQQENANKTNAFSASNSHVCHQCPSHSPDAQRTASSSRDGVLGACTGAPLVFDNNNNLTSAITDRNIDSSVSMKCLQNYSNLKVENAESNEGPALMGKKGDTTAMQLTSSAVSTAASISSYPAPSSTISAATCMFIHKYNDNNKSNEDNTDTCNDGLNNQSSVKRSNSKIEMKNMVEESDGTFAKAATKGGFEGSASHDYDQTKLEASLWMHTRDSERPLHANENNRTSKKTINIFINTTNNDTTTTNGDTTTTKNDTTTTNNDTTTTNNDTTTTKNDTTTTNNDTTTTNNDTTTTNNDTTTTNNDTTNNDTTTTNSDTTTNKATTTKNGTATNNNNTINDTVNTTKKITNGLTTSNKIIDDIPTTSITSTTITATNTINTTITTNTIDTTITATNTIDTTITATNTIDTTITATNTIDTTITATNTIDTTIVTTTTSSTSTIISNSATTISDVDFKHSRNNASNNQLEPKWIDHTRHSSSPTAFHTLSTSVITTTTFSSTTICTTTIINNVQKTCIATTPSSHHYLQSKCLSGSLNKANGRYDGEAEAMKSDKALEESRADARSKIFDSYYDSKVANKRIIDHKNRLNEGSASKSAEARMETEGWKKSQNSIVSKEKEERVKEKTKEGRKGLPNQGTKPQTPSNNGSSRKHQQASSEPPSKKSRSEAASEAEAFYKSFQSIFGNPPLPFDLFMDPFYRIAIMSDPLIFHKNLIEAQSQMAKSLTSGGVSVPPAGLPFSYLNPIFSNQQPPSRVEETKPVDMSAKKATSQTSPKVDGLSSTSWAPYMLPPSSSSHFFGPLKDSGSDVTSRPFFDFLNEASLFSGHKESPQQKTSSPYNQHSTLLNQSNFNTSSHKSSTKASISCNSDYSRYCPNQYQGSFGNDRMKKYDGYMNTLNAINSNNNTFTYSSQTNKGRVREDSSKKMYSPNLPTLPSKRQDIFKNPISLPTLLSQPLAPFELTSQSQHLQPSTKSHLQSNYDAFTSLSSTSNFYYPPSQQQQQQQHHHHHHQAPPQSPQHRKLISPFKSKSPFNDAAFLQNSKINHFYSKNNYYNNYNYYNNSNKNDNNNNSIKKMTHPSSQPSTSSSLSSSFFSSSSSSSSSSSLFSSSSSFSSSFSSPFYSSSSSSSTSFSSYPATISNHFSAASLLSKQPSKYHSPHFTAPPSTSHNHYSG